MPSIPYPRAATQEGQVDSATRLRCYTELNRHSIAEGLTSLYRIWLICRAMDSEGRGVVSRDALLVAMAEHGLHPSQLRRIRHHPQLSAFLTFYPHKIEYRSLQAVCTALQVEPGPSLYIPVECLASTETFRATLYATWIAGHESLLISRERLTALFQVSAATQRRWESLTGVLVTFNVVEVSENDAAAAAQHLPLDARLDQFDRLDRSYSWKYQGNLYYRTVNRYEAPSNLQLQRAATGNVRKVTRAVRHILPVDDHGDGTGHAERRRIFYDGRTTPGNYQEAKGDCMRATPRRITTDRGRSALWQFSQWRPVDRRTALG